MASSVKAAKTMYTASNLRQWIQYFENLMCETHEKLENGQEVVEVDISEFLDFFHPYAIQQAFEEHFNVVDDVCDGDITIKVSL